MSRYNLCIFLKREFREIHPRDLERATHLMVRLAVRCVEPEQFRELFEAARFDKTPVPPRIDPELWEERPVESDWNNVFDDDEYPEAFSEPESEEEPNRETQNPIDALLAAGFE